MNFKKEYEDLYNQWKDELEQVNLTDLSEGNFILYHDIKSKINDYYQNDNDPIKIRLIKEFRKNFNYLFDDFLHIRKIKIINLAMCLEEIKLDHLIKRERKFYQNLVGSFKAYNKIKTAPPLERPQEKIFSEEVATEILKKNILEVPEKEEQIQSAYMEEESNMEAEFNIEEESNIQEESNYHYTLIRMVKNSPPLVGVDLKNYGPFEKEDVINLPFKNAIILINEKFAEKIELS